MNAPEESAQNISFRDPGGHVFRVGGRIFRAVSADASPVLNSFLHTGLASSLQNEGKLVRTWDAEDLPAGVHPGPARTVEHQAVDFPSYPAEWCPEMLGTAGHLTLDLCEGLLASGWGLKDATPLNVLFRGPDPVFVDLLSFEQRDASDPAWTPYAQFVRTFLLPLLANRELGHSMREIWLENRDGLDPERIYPWLPFLRRFKGPALSLVTLPAMMTKKAKNTAPSVAVRHTAPDQAAFILRALFRGLRKDLNRLTPQSLPDSQWSDYTTTRTHYNDTQRAIKQAFVRRCLAEAKPAWCLDLGANTGEFSEIAAETSQVVAIDYDVASVARIYRRAREAKRNILPLCLDACRPTPATGWRNAEQPSFLTRCEGRFDMVMMLAVVHHMMVTERVPVAEIVALAAHLTTGHAIIEYVGPEDPMFRQLLRGREALHEGLTASVFEAALKQEFRIEATCPVQGMDRSLYWVKRG